MASLNASATLAPLPYFDAWMYSIFMAPSFRFPERPNEEPTHIQRGSERAGIQGRSDLCTGTHPATAMVGDRVGPPERVLDGVSPTGGDVRTPGEPAVVTRTVDGDTIHVTFRGHDLDVRLIGIDTPETVDPSQPVQCYGEQASRFTDRSLTGRTVRLEFDVERLDRYGRTLAYVWLRGHLFNRRLVAGGYAVVDTFPPNVRYVDVFTAAQRVARERDRGLWGACSPLD